MEDINHLVVTPFRDISIKATEALNNAGEKQDMHKAAQKLAKEGERALKRIEPLCTKLQNEYGENFLNALRENSKFTLFSVFEDISALPIPQGLCKANQL
jgi:hypothetical protein